VKKGFTKANLALDLSDLDSKLKYNHDMLEILEVCIFPGAKALAGTQIAEGFDKNKTRANIGKLTTPYRVSTHTRYCSLLLVQV
jgi:hypothetical protein